MLVIAQYAFLFWQTFTYSEDRRQHVHTLTFALCAVLDLKLEKAEKSVVVITGVNPSPVTHARVSHNPINFQSHVLVFPSSTMAAKRAPTQRAP